VVSWECFACGKSSLFLSLSGKQPEDCSHSFDWHNRDAGCVVLDFVYQELREIDRQSVQRHRRGMRTVGLTGQGGPGSHDFPGLPYCLQNFCARRRASAISALVILVCMTSQT
jgi:hypothetical protein